MSEHRQSPPARVSERLYAAVVALYPRRFRRDYGAALQQVFREMLDDRDTPAWRAWLAILADLPGSVLPEHLADLRGGDEMEPRRLMNTPGIRQGVAAGCALGLVHAVYSVLNNGFNLDARGNALLTNGFMAALVLLCGSAGFLGSRGARSIGAGAYAGAVAALVGSVLGLVALWVATFVFFEQIRHNTFMIEDFRRSGARSMDAFIVEDALGASFFGSLASLVLGTALGTLGGLVATVTRRPLP
jgi:hypothetical protein